MPINNPTQNLLERIWNNSPSSSPTGGTPKKTPNSTPTKTKGSRKTKASKPRSRKSAPKPTAEPKKLKRGMKNSRGRGAGRSLKNVSKPNPAQNISKFGGGLKGRYGATLTGLKTLAIRQGAKGLTLGKVLVGTGFFAGINSVPGVALIVGNYVIWKKNIEDIYKLCGKQAPWLINKLPVHQDVVTPGQLIPYVGGGNYTNYLAKGTFTSQSNRISRHRCGEKGFWAIPQDRPIPGRVISWESVPEQAAFIFTSQDQQGQLSTTKVPCYLSISDNGSATGTVIGYSNSCVDRRQVAVGNNFRVTEIFRADGQPDIPEKQEFSEPIISLGGVTNNHYTTVNRISNNTPTQLKPSTQPKPNKEKDKTPIVTPVPSTIPVPVPQSPNSVNFPDYVRNGLPIVTDNPIPNDTVKKPSASVKKTYFPNVGETPDEAKARAAKLRGRIGEIEKENSEEITTVPTLPFLPIPGRVENPGITTKFKNKPSASPSPTPTKINPCKKGCGGGGGISAGTGSSNTAASEILDSALLLRIDRNTTRTVNTVTDANFGLAKIQKYAETAWKVTRADKVMAGVSMALTVHNAMMLSNNLLSTVSEATNMTLNALNIRDEEDTPIDLGNAVRGLMDKVLSGLLGDAKYAEITARIAKANRIYQTGINLLDTTYSLFDSARTVAELTGEYTGKIGNALRESGAVYEDAYEEFLEKINPQNAAMRRLGSFRDKIEVAENAFDSVAQISGSVLEVKETVGQIKEEKTELKAELDDFLKAQEEEKDTAKTQVQVATEVNENDFDRTVEES